MGYRPRRTQRAQHHTFGLNITSMTDMFTILLVFLLQTYSTSDFEIEPQAGIKLPVSNSATTPTKAIQVSLSKTELKIEGRTVASLRDGDFQMTDLEKTDTNFILPFFGELDKGAKEGAAKDGKLFLQADSSIRYDTLRKVIYTASMAGYPSLKLATVTGN